MRSRLKPKFANRGEAGMSEIEDEIKREIAAHKVLVYAKGTKTQPKCGFTAETIKYFEKYNIPFEVIDVLSTPEKREALSRMTDWPTLPKVFIDGQFYGDTDILDEMEAKGEIQPLLKSIFNS